MKKTLLLTLTLITFTTVKLTANTSPGDTVIVQTFTNLSPQDAWFVFPSDTLHCEKVLMKYTLKCNPAQIPPCGEWDYLTYTYLYKPTGLLDSTLIHQPIYTVNGATPATVAYMNSPSYSYTPHWQYNMVNTATTSLITDTVGFGVTNGTAPFGASHPVSHSQYLWKASEITAAGMGAGNITGLQFYLQSLGAQMHNMTIRIQSTPLDSLTQATYNDTAFTTVYSQNTLFSSTGWNSLQFITPFYWNGTSNLVIDITYDNVVADIDNTVASTNTTFSSGLTNAGTDRVAAFHSYGYVNVPLNNKLTSIDSAVTVSFWCYGSPSLQPMNGTAFEAVDSVGNRLLNSHLPWGDSKIYWDAGYGGTSYDRISQTATSIEIKGKWNYWTFTKNVATGSMKVYLNGNLWLSGSSKTKRMIGIKNFHIGQGNWGGSQTYEGKIDEFAVFNAELSQATIQAYMSKRIDALHPNYTNLALYYHFDDGNYSTFFDVAPGLHPMATDVATDNPLRAAAEINTNFTQTTLRPNIIFEQGVYTQHLDSTLVVDSTATTPIQIITYTDSVSNPGVAIDTFNVWPAYYNNYVYDAAGNAIDSTLVTPDSTINLVYYNYYNHFPQVLRFELGRYITPYGNSLSLGSGWTWTFDVSDYKPLLHDSVHLSAGNWQELLDVKFLMIKGTPPRNVLSVQNLWNGGFTYGHDSDPIENHLPALTVNIPVSAKNTRWKSRVTGHGMDLPEDCAEFCPKNHYYKVNGVLQYSKSVWRNNCNLNPLYPQGGTWVYSRANWCPGAEVWTYDWELTPFVTPGTSALLDHDVQPYSDTDGNWDYYQIEDQLVSYGDPNFTLDAAIDDIIAPSKDQMWGRMNPVCTAPIVRIRNTGSTPLTSLTITYGLSGATASTYHWTGNLKIDETAEVTLGTFAWAYGTPDFTVTASSPNGGTDQYAPNNTKISKFTYPYVMPPTFVIWFKTNHFADDSYTIKNDAGTVVYSNNGAIANHQYKDTVFLPTGCYTFELNDLSEDGLTWWADTAQGTGSLSFHKLTPATVTLRNFGADFGGKVYMQFTVGLYSDIQDYVFTNTSTMNVYPNPSTGHVTIDIDLNAKKDGRIEITDMLGRKVFNYDFKNIIADKIEADLSAYSKGMYFVTFRSGNEFISKKVMIQ